MYVRRRGRAGWLLFVAMSAGIAGPAVLADDGSVPPARAPEAVARLHAECLGILREALALRGWDTHLTRLEAAQALYGTDRDAARAAILASYEAPPPADQKVWERDGALRTMGRTGDGFFFDRVKACLADPRVFQAALDVLPEVARGREAEARAAARPIFETDGPPRGPDPQPTTRVFGYAKVAAYALHDLGDRGVCELLRKLALTGDPWNRSLALEHLLEDGDPAVSLAMAGWWARDPNRETVRRGAELLGRFGADSDRPILEELARSDYELVSLPAAEGVARLGALERARPVFERAVEAGSLVALEPLVRWGGPGAVEVLAKRHRAGKEHPHFRVSVAAALRAAIEKHHPGVLQPAAGGAATR